MASHGRIFPYMRSHIGPCTDELGRLPRPAPGVYTPPDGADGVAILSGASTGRGGRGGRGTTYEYMLLHIKGHLRDGVEPSLGACSVNAQFPGRYQGLQGRDNALAASAQDLGQSLSTEPWALGNKPPQELHGLGKLLGAGGGGGFTGSVKALGVSTTGTGTGGAGVGGGGSVDTAWGVTLGWLGLGLGGGGGGVTSSLTRVIVTGSEIAGFACVE